MYPLPEEPQRQDGNLIYEKYHKFWIETTASASASARATTNCGIVTLPAIFYSFNTVVQ
jgi:hypothetical protein